MTRRRKLLLAAVALLSIAGLWSWRAWSPGAPPYAAPGLASIELRHRLRNGPEHDTARERVGTPYVLQVGTDSGSLLYYGAEHRSDPDDPQVADIERRWAEFRPTVALCEGRSRGYFLGFPFDQLAGRPEPAIVHALARRDDVRLLSLEPTYADEVAALLRDWSPEQVALYFTLRVYWSEAGGEPDDDLARDLLAKRTNVEGLTGSIDAVSDLDAIWRRDFAGAGDWRMLKREPPGSYLEELSHASRRVRGEHMARTLIDLVRRGERVLAVVGSGHVICQEWALRAALGAAPSWDQPR